MNSLETIPVHLGVEGHWTERGGAYWLEAEGLEVREVASAMNALGARFVTITAYQLRGGAGIRLEYHWDLEARLLGFTFLLEGSSVESIHDLCEAADWVEREVYEEYAVEFTGRKYEPLLLRPGAKPGVYLREEAVK